MKNQDGGSRARVPGPAEQAAGCRPLSAKDARWRRDQHARQRSSVRGERQRRLARRGLRRRLTRRGLATIGMLLSSVLAAMIWAVEPLESALREQTSPAEQPTQLAMLPPVGAAAPRVEPREVVPRPRVEPPNRVPDEVLERLPISRSALELEETRPAGTRSSGRLIEAIDRRYPAGPLQIEYTLDAELTRHVFRVLRRGRVSLGNVVVMEPISGRVLAYAATDPQRFPPTRHYPAASLVKVITAAAALGQSPRLARLPCRYSGSPYRLTPSRVDPPANGRTVSLRRALATSNNQCLAQLAVHALGAAPLMDAIARFGWLDSPGPGHAAGSAEAGQEPYDLGRLGSGLSGTRITPLHAVQLAAMLAHGELVAPRWVERVVDPQGRELALPASPAPRRVLGPELTDELRGMLVDTTRLGTARRAFRKRGGAPLLGSVAVAGKTGSLSGRSPDGRYEWFIGVAPADSPRVAVATVLVQNDLWWRNASQIAAEVLRGVFCNDGDCRAENAGRYIQVPAAAAALTRAKSLPVAVLH